jgi:hypothetical protein
MEETVLPMMTTELENTVHIAFTKKINLIFVHFS